MLSFFQFAGGGIFYEKNNETLIRCEVGQPSSANH